jgi:protein-tyrosine phosphatase
MVAEFSLVLPACRNLRDLGGIQTATGGSVRSGVLLRGGSPHDAKPQALAGLAGAIRTLIDLRRVDEAAVFAFTPPDGVRVVSCPFETAGVGTLDGTDVATSLLDSYLRIAIGSREPIVRLFETLADPANLPALIFCAAGKDRTGVAVALVLSALGVPDPAIVADYALTGTVDPTTFSKAYAERLAAMPAWFREAAPHTMEAFLDELRTEYGSVRDFVRSLGVREADLAAVDLNLRTA